MEAIITVYCCIAVTPVTQHVLMLVIQTRRRQRLPKPGGGLRAGVLGLFHAAPQERLDLLPSGAPNLGAQRRQQRVGECCSSTFPLAVRLRRVCARPQVRSATIPCYRRAEPLRRVLTAFVPLGLPRKQRATRLATHS